MKRLSTHIEGLDEVLGGGIPEGNVVLVSGAPGTMKTSLTYHILHSSALDGSRGLYVSLEQGRASLIDHTEGLGYRLDDTHGNLSVLDLGTLRKKLTGSAEQPWLDLFKLYTQGIRKSFDYRFLVLDSLDALEILAKFREPRREMFSLIRWLRDLRCTAFLLGELPTDRTGGADPRRAAYAKHKEDYLADGILHLRVARQGEFGMQRQLRVVKMRGTRHETCYHALVFDNGLRVTRILAGAIADDKFLDAVLRLLASRVVGFEPWPDLAPELGLAVSAEALAALAGPLDLREVAVIGLEDVVVLGEDRANVWVRPKPALLLDRSAPAREGVHDLLLRLSLGIRREDAGLRNRGRHFPGRSQEAGKELVVNQGRFRIAEPRGHVSGDPEMRILVDPARDEDGDVATGLHGRQEGGRGLDTRVEDLADVVRVLEAEDRLGRREGDPLRDLHRDRVQMPDVLRIEENPRQLRVKAHRDDVEDVVVPDLRGFVELVEILEEKLLVVRDLEV